jgi:hypothetical protein
MKRSRVTDQQTGFALKQTEQETQVGEIPHKMGIGEQTLSFDGESRTLGS